MGRFMKGHSLLHKGIWLIALIAVVALHGTLLYYITSHVALSAMLVSCLAILLIVKVIIVKRRGVPHKSVLCLIATLAADLRRAKQRVSFLILFTN